MSELRIAVDAMGGDFAPREVVTGTVEAAKAFPHITRILLVGDEAAVMRELEKFPEVPRNIEVVHASQVVGMDESPAIAIRKKKDSSISRSVDLIKEGRADAVFSAGNTGAAVAATTLKLRTLEGIERPGIATVFPTPVKPFVLIDAGATTDCTPRILVQFAVMGMVYSREILKCPKPAIGLLSIGEEESKGNEATKEAFKILEKSGLNFVGNVESRDLFEGGVDVVVCDGFVGNVVLKTSESVARTISHWIREECSKNVLRMMGALLARGAFRTIKERSDPAVYGGAPLLGINGVCIIGHGASSAFAVRNGIRVAAESVKHQVNHLVIGEARKILAGLS